MSPRAVTEDASAASTASPIEQAFESGFLPDDPHYRRTGKFKDSAVTEDAPAASTSSHQEESEEQEIESADTEEASAASASQEEESADTAAAPAAAPEQKGKEGKTVQTRTQKTSESRWAKLSRENRELRAWKARREASSSTQTQREPEQVSQPAAKTETQANSEPLIDDVDPKTGKLAFTTFDEWQKAHDKWNRQEAIREFQEVSAKTAKEQRIAEAKQTIAKQWSDHVTKARSKYADYDEVALDPDLPLKEGSVADVFILDSPQGTDVLYYLGQNPQELERINGLNPIAQARELTKIELKISGAATDKEKSSSAKPVTQAPRPPHQVSGKGTVAKDAVEQALEEGDVAAYMREQNARDPRLAALRKRK